MPFLVTAFPGRSGSWPEAHPEMQPGSLPVVMSDNAYINGRGMGRETDVELATGPVDEGNLPILVTKDIRWGGDLRSNLGTQSTCTLQRTQAARQGRGFVSTVKEKGQYLGYHARTSASLVVTEQGVMRKRSQQDAGRVTMVQGEVEGAQRLSLAVLDALVSSADAEKMRAVKPRETLWSSLSRNNREDLTGRG